MVWYDDISEIFMRAWNLPVIWTDAPPTTLTGILQEVRLLIGIPRQASCSGPMRQRLAPVSAKACICFAVPGGFVRGSTRTGSRRLGCGGDIDIQKKSSSGELSCIA